MLDRLFDEIIREIVQYAYTDRLRLLIPIRSPCHLPPVAASQVCRSWRYALLSDPTMWTCIRIPQMKPDGIKEMLHRSIQAPLHVFVDTGGSGFSFDVSAYLPDTLSLLFENIGRFGTLHMPLYYPDVKPVAELLEQVLPYLGRPAPLLQSFYLHVENEGLLEDESFLQNLFSGHAPNLKYVYRQIVAGFHEVLRSPLFQNLSSLHFNLDASRALYFDSFLDVLESSPRLRTFQIEAPSNTLLDVIPPRSSDRKINLSNLQTLLIWIIGRIKFLDLFKKHVRFPQIEHCHIKWYDLPYERRSSTESLRYFIRRYPMRRLSLNFSGGGATVTFSRDRSMETDFSIMYNCRGVSGFERVGSFFALVNRCKLENIKEFWIMPETRLETGILRTLLVNMFHLEKLHIVQFPGTSLPLKPILTALMPHYTQPFPKIAYMLPGVSLRELDIVILDSMVDEEDTMQTRLNEEHASMLRVCSDSRREYGYSFEKITIHVPCLKTDLTEEVEAILEPREGFPVKLIESTPGLLTK